MGLCAKIGAVCSQAAWPACIQPLAAAVRRAPARPDLGCAAAAQDPSDLPSAAAVAGGKAQWRYRLLRRTAVAAPSGSSGGGSGSGGSNSNAVGGGSGSVFALNVGDLVLLSVDGRHPAVARVVVEAIDEVQWGPACAVIPCESCTECQHHAMGAPLNQPLLPKGNVLYASCVAWQLAVNRPLIGDSFVPA